jgi:hypothetical protein
MPLFSYVYAVPQVLSAGLVSGRLTSILISTGIVSMSIVIAQRYAGAQGGALTVLLFAAFNLGIYFDTVVKTYALIAFFLTGTCSRSCSRSPPGSGVSLRSFLSHPSFFTCSSARPAAPAGFLSGRVWPLVCSPVFLSSELDCRALGLLSSHLRRWGELSTLERLDVILTERMPDIIQTFGPLLVLMAASLYILVAVDGIGTGMGKV